MGIPLPRVFSHSGAGQNRCCRFAEEAHQTLDVLGHRCQEELLAHELQPPQAHAT
jgi:hypothetical protein